MKKVQSGDDSTKEKNHRSEVKNNNQN